MVRVSYEVRCEVEKQEEFPKELPVLPRVGEFVESLYDWKGNGSISLEVVKIWHGKRDDYYGPIIVLMNPTELDRRTFYTEYAKLNGEDVKKYLV